MLRLCAIGCTRIHGFIGTEGEALRATRAMLDALPPMTAGDRRAASSSLRAARLLSAEGLTARPLRAPHYSASPAAIFGNALSPGEIAFAHLGALVLLDASRFRSSILAALPRVLRAGHVDGIPMRPAAVVLHVPRSMR